MIMIRNEILMPTTAMAMMLLSCHPPRNLAAVIASHKAKPLPKMNPGKSSCSEAGKPAAMSWLTGWSLANELPKSKLNNCLRYSK